MARIRLILFSVMAALVVSCGREPGEPSATDEAMAELQRLYEEVKDKEAEDAVDWAKEDIQKFGDWEYRVVTVADAPPAELEASLNELGSERWEVFWVERSADGLRLFLKRPAKSYLRSLPLSELGKTVTSGGEE